MAGPRVKRQRVGDAVSKDDTLLEILGSMNKKIAAFEASAPQHEIFAGTLANVRGLVANCDANPNIMTAVLNGMSSPGLQKVNSAMSNTKLDYILSVVGKNVFGGDQARLTSLESAVKEVREIVVDTVKLVFAREFTTECGTNDIDGFRDVVGKAILEQGNRKR